MRANEFILESDEFDDVVAAKNVIANCQPFLKAANGRDIYRGSRGLEVLNTVRKDRRPMDTKRSHHKIADQYLFKMFGIRFRSQAMFATGDAFDAGGYGRKYLVYPIGNFDYCWSPKVSDMTVNLSRLKSDMLLSIGDGEFRKKLYDAGYRCNVSMEDFQAAIDSGNEIMINCDNYYAIDWNFAEEFIYELTQQMRG